MVSLTQSNIAAFASGWCKLLHLEEHRSARGLSEGRGQEGAVGKDLCKPVSGDVRNAPSHRSREESLSRMGHARRGREVRREPVASASSEVTYAQQAIAPAPSALMVQRPYAIPRQGYVLSTAAETYGQPVRAVVELLATAFEDNRSSLIGAWEECYQTRGPNGGADGGRSALELAARASVANWLVGVASGELDVSAGLLDAETWFLAVNDGPCRFAPADALRAAEAYLQALPVNAALGDLLPYVLDPHGPGTRLSVIRDPGTVEVQARRRAEGVYYTPADVAAFMAQEALSELEREAYPLTVFDPACGTGVFLRAALDVLAGRATPYARFQLACLCLYGADVDPWALDATSYVLTHSCRNAGVAGLPYPRAMWHALRMNLVNIDTLRLDPGAHNEPGDAREARVACRAKLKSGVVPPVGRAMLSPGFISISHVFPELGCGPRIVVGNPPYADIGQRADSVQLAARFMTFAAAPRPTSDIYPLFVEQMIRLAAADSHGGALVLPLSIACNTGPQYAALRARLSNEPGTWRFAFFDREPHALFGEDVKTRNTIVLWKKHAVEHGVSVQTGPLRKWRGQDRAALFEKIGYTPIAVDLRVGIPKVEGANEARTLEHLIGLPTTLERVVTKIGRASLQEALNEKGHFVYIGATAYNFLNIFLPLGSQFALTGDDRLSENPLFALLCRNREDQLAVYAALNGNLAFWWWHVHGDGFHVSRHTLTGMPVGAALLDRQCASRLSAIGESMWKAIAREPKVSKNRGRVSLGFSAVPHSENRREADELLLSANGLPTPFAADLADFSVRVVSAQNF